MESVDELSSTGRGFGRGLNCPEDVPERVSDERTTAGVTNTMSDRTETFDGENANTQTTADSTSFSTGDKPDGSLAILTGGVLLALALKLGRKRIRGATLFSLGALALFGVGIRDWWLNRNTDTIETEEDVQRDAEGNKTVSDEAYTGKAGDLGAERVADESQSVYQSETEPNPRGMSDRADVQKDDGGDIDFVEGKEPGKHQETHLEGTHDSRLDTEQGDEQTEVDLSNVAMADEVSEAVGPHPEQAYPAREGTDPEPTSEKAPERVNEETTAPSGSNALTEDDETVNEERSSDSDNQNESEKDQ